MKKYKEMVQKRMGNKGFSLVELIIVIAIMAVLVGVLAPQYLKYVEKSRVAADDTVAAEIKNAVNVLLTDEDYYDDITQEFTVSWYGADTNKDKIVIGGTGATGAQLTAIKTGLNEYLSLGFTTGSSDTTTTAAKEMKAKGHVPSNETPNPDATGTEAGVADSTTYTITATVTNKAVIVSSAGWVETTTPPSGGDD